MNTPNGPTGNRGLRARLKDQLRHNKLLIALELGIALLIFTAYLADLLPFSEVPFLFLLGWLSLRLRGLGWRDVGLRRPARWGQSIALGTTVGVLFQLLGTFVLEPMIARLSGSPADLSQFAEVQGNILPALILLALAWILGAFGEEFVYRGYLMKRLVDIVPGGTTAWVVSLILVSTLFGVGHLYQGVSGIAINILAGFVYGAVYLATGRNLWAAIIAHGVYDTLGVAFIFWGVGMSH